MVISGKKATNRASPQQVAQATVRCLKRHVPGAVPGIAFLSGGQASQEATLHLSLMNQISGLPWNLTFSYGRALQDAALKGWGGTAAGYAVGQKGVPDPGPPEWAGQRRPLHRRPSKTRPPEATRIQVTDSKTSPGPRCSGRAT